MAKITGAQALAAALRAHDVTHIFFVTGSPAGLWPAFEAAGIELILARSEMAAAYMADGYARLSGKPGVCFGQPGPAAANLAAGVAEPWMASSAVIAITGSRDSRFHHTNAYQELDQLGLFQSVSKYNVQVRHTARIRETVRNAFRIAVSGNPRPVHLDFIDEAVVGETESRVLGESDLYQTYPGSRTRPDEAAVQSACARLQQAERPIIVAGHGAVMSQAWDEILELAEQLSIPVATTLSGKGSIAETHPLALGVVGQYSRNCTNQIVSEADLVFFIGCKTGGLATNNQQVPAKGTPIIHLDIDTHEIGRNYPTEAAIVGDAKLGLQACLTELRKINSVPSNAGWAEYVQQVVGDWRREAASIMRSDQSPIHPARVIRELRAYLDDEDIVVADTGYMGAWVGALFETRIPGRTIIRAAGSLGWGLPAAIGAKSAAPDRRVLAVSGDGGVGYHLMEMETAVRCEVPFVAVIFNNRALAFEYHVQKYLYGGKAESTNRFSDVDYAQVAQDLGAFGRRVEQPEEIRGALDDAFQSGKPALLDVIVDKEAIAPVTSYTGLAPKPL